MASPSWYPLVIFSGRNSSLWACGAVGSALPWHGRGQGFESLQVHQFTPRDTKIRKRRGLLRRLSERYELRAVDARSISCTGTVSLRGSFTGEGAAMRSSAMRAAVLPICPLF